MVGTVGTADTTDASGTEGTAGASGAAGAVPTPGTGFSKSGRIESSVSKQYSHLRGRASGQRQQFKM